MEDQVDGMTRQWSGLTTSSWPILESSILAENTFHILSYGLTGEMVRTEFGGMYVIVGNSTRTGPALPPPPMTMTNQINYK